MSRKAGIISNNALQEQTLNSVSFKKIQNEKSVILPQTIHLDDMQKEFNGPICAVRVDNHVTISKKIDTGVEKVLHTPVFHEVLNCTSSLPVHKMAIALENYSDHVQKRKEENLEDFLENVQNRVSEATEHEDRRQKERRKEIDAVVEGLEELREGNFSEAERREIFTRRRQIAMDKERRKARERRSAIEQKELELKRKQEKEKLQQRRLIAEQKEQIRLLEEEQASSVRREQELAARRNDVEERRKNAARIKMEQERHALAMRQAVREKIARVYGTLPPLCPCSQGSDVFDHNPENCAVNCPFFRNHDLYTALLQQIVDNYE